VAIKTVKKEFIDQDPKVKENLDREIEIMKALSDCQYAVRLHNVMVRLSNLIVYTYTGVNINQTNCIMSLDLLL